jgi:hypothetical protein
MPVMVAVPLELLTKLTPVGRAPVSDKAASGLPVVVTVKVPVTPTVNVELVALVITGGTFTVTDVVAVVDAGIVAELVTVRV